MRPLCICGFRPAAVNYKKNGRTFYRKKCEKCLHSSTTKIGISKYKIIGYEKKKFCEKCGFKSPYDEIFNIFHVDGNLKNLRFNNLKTICANCQRVLHINGVKWKQGDLLPDF